MTAETATEVIPDVRAGDRITVHAGARSANSTRRITRPVTLEVTTVQHDEPGHLTVSGLVLTKLGTYSAAGVLQGRNVRAFHITGPAGDGWAWFGEAPAAHTRAALGADLVAAYGIDRREAAVAVDLAAATVRIADAGRYGTDGNVPGWSPARDEPTEAGAQVMRERLAATYAPVAAKAASAAVRLGCPRTIDPRGRMVFTDGHGRGWVLQLSADNAAGAHIVGSIAPHGTLMHPLTSDTWPQGVPAVAGDAAIARKHLRDAAEPATVQLPQVGTVPALGAYLRPVALACADAVAGRWLVVAWPADAAPTIVGDSDESTQARTLAHQAVGLHGTTRVYLARRTAYGTTVYARTGEGAAFGTMPAEAPTAVPAVRRPRRAWEHLVRGAGVSDPQGHAANVREAVRRALGLPAGATAEAIDQASAKAEALTFAGDQPWLAYLAAYVHVVGDPIGHRTAR